MDALKIVAKIIALPEFRQDILSSIKSLEKASRGEDGNISYIAHQDIQNQNKFVILEVWKSQSAIDFHNNTPHFEAFKQEISGKIGTLEIDVMKEI